MKFSARAAFKSLDNVYEIKCPHNRLADVYDYFKQEKVDKRCNVTYPEATISEEFIEQLNYIKAVIENYTVSCTNFGAMCELLDRGYNAYFAYPITDWEIFQTLKTLGVSDIYIDGPLGFQMPQIKNGKGEVLIRVSPNQSSNASLSQGNNINTFYIRPEDLHLYEDVVDIIDFQVKDKDMEKTLLDIYSRGTFDHNLNLLIKQLSTEILNPFISKEFGERRFDCGQRCMVPGRACHFCDSQFKLTNTLLNYFKKNN